MEKKRVTTGAQIKAAREAAGFTGTNGRQRAALHLGYSERYIAHVERQGAPSLMIAEKMAKAYGCSLNIFYCLVGSKSPETEEAKSTASRKPKPRAA